MLRIAFSTKFRAAANAVTSFSRPRTFSSSGSIEVTNYEHLKILIFDARSQAHSIEILNPQTMRIYDEMPGRGFAVSFVSDDEKGVETRCYIRDEGEDDERIHERTALESITLPQLFEYLDEITAIDVRTRK